MDVAFAYYLATLAIVMSGVLAFHMGRLARATERQNKHLERIAECLGAVSAETSTQTRRRLFGPYER